MRTTARKKLHALQLAAVIFLTVSGGPYGLEPLLSNVGEHAALLLLILTPLLWDIPTIFVVLELNSMMPVTGGYYQWVKRALGLRFAFYEGWWTWLYTFADLAIYPVLFVTYLAYFFPQADTYKIPICLVVVWLSAGVNILGIVPVGRISIILSVLVFIPFLVLFGWALVQGHGHFSLPHQSLHGQSFSAIGLGLYTVMWNFIGWDNVTTYAEEVSKPVRTYLVSVGIAFLLVLSIYLIATVLAMNAHIDPETLSEEGFPALGRMIGGYWLGAIVAFGGMASALGLFSAVLLSVSRIPKVMADDGLMPAALHRLHPKFKSPYISILCCALVVSVMVFWTFGELLIIDITLYGGALFLEYLALIRLRRTAPGEHRPFRIPLGIPGLIVMTLLPLSVYLIALIATLTSSGTAFRPLIFALCILFSAEILWQIIARKK